MSVQWTMVDVSTIAQTLWEVLCAVVDLDTS